jgi:hypothetical protein
MRTGESWVNAVCCLGGDCEAMWGIDEELKVAGVGRAQIEE